MSHPAHKTRNDQVVLVEGIPMRAEDGGQAPAGNGAAHFNFDAGDFCGLSGKRLVAAYSAQIQSQVVRIGDKAARFELRPGDYISQGHRAELRDWLNAPLEQETWYGLSFLLPEDFPIHEGVGCVLAQWHDQAKLGDPSGKPPLAIRFKAGRLFITGAQSCIASHEPDQRFELFSRDDFPLGVWCDVVFRIFWSQHKETQVEAWMNGERIIHFHGKLGYENEAVGPYFKFGMYCHGAFATPHVAYHDNYSRGHSFAEVNPAVSHRGGPL